MSAEETFPEKLEASLQTSGVDLEVYNLGAPGTPISHHLTVAEHYIKELSPKIVILSVLLSDDFQQEAERRVLEKLKPRDFVSGLKRCFELVSQIFTVLTKQSSLQAETLVNRIEFLLRRIGRLTESPLWIEMQINILTRYAIGSKAAI